MSLIERVRARLARRSYRRAMLRAIDAASERFRGLVNDHSHEWTPLPEGSFRAADTGVSTGILTIRKGTI